MLYGYWFLGCWFLGTLLIYRMFTRLNCGPTDAHAILGSEVECCVTPLDTKEILALSVTAALGIAVMLTVGLWCLGIICHFLKFC